MSLSSIDEYSDTHHPLYVLCRGWKKYSYDDFLRLNGRIIICVIRLGWFTMSRSTSSAVVFFRHLSAISDTIFYAISPTHPAEKLERCVCCLVPNYFIFRWKQTVFLRYKDEQVRASVPKSSRTESRLMNASTHKAVWVVRRDYSNLKNCQNWSHKEEDKVLQKAKS